MYKPHVKKKAKSPQQTLQEFNETVSYSQTSLNRQLCCLPVNTTMCFQMKNISSSLLMDRASPTPSVQVQLLTFPIFTRRALLCVFFILLLSFLLFQNLIDPFKSQSTIDTAVSSDDLPNHKNSSLGDCNYSEGRWIRNESHTSQLYTEECPFLDPGFRCQQNGRHNSRYRQWQWKPKDCDLPRFNAKDFLERSQNARIVFAGDSIGRNQWESLVCMLAQPVTNWSTIYEERRNPISKHKGYLSIRFQEYNLTVEYYRVPFLVTVDHPPGNSSDKIRRSIRVDQLHWYSKQWVGGDVLLFNAGHWWNQDKIVKMYYFTEFKPFDLPFLTEVNWWLTTFIYCARGCYFQEGQTVNMTMTVMEAFSKALQTWKFWVIQHTDPQKSQIFFRSSSPVHFRGGTWKEGGRCDNSTEPETDYSKLEAEPWNNMYIYETIEQMKGTNKIVNFLNITYLTEFRLDGHPSIHREPGTPVPFRQDCSHWCLPGVPDTWNKLLYAQLLSKDYRTKKSQ